MQILLQRRGLSLNPITTMYYIAPASFAFLALPWSVIEARAVMTDPTVKLDVPIFVSNAAGACLMPWPLVKVVCGSSRPICV